MADANCLMELIHTSTTYRHTMVVCFTPIQDAKEKTTVLFPQKKKMDSEPSDDIQLLHRGSVLELLNLHLTRPSMPAPLRAPTTYEDTVRYIVNRNQRALRRFVKRGLYVPVADEEGSVQ